MESYLVQYVPVEISSNLRLRVDSYSYNGSSNRRRRDGAEHTPRAVCDSVQDQISYVGVRYVESSFGGLGPDKFDLSVEGLLEVVSLLASLDPKLEGHRVALIMTYKRHDVLGYRRIHALVDVEVLWPWSIDELGIRERKRRTMVILPVLLFRSSKRRWPVSL